MQDSLIKIRDEVSTEVVGRDEIVHTALCTLLAGEHIMLVGPPGNAKTMMFEAILDRIDGANVFKTLFTPFTQPDEVLGPIMLSELKKDRVKRNTEGFLPWADYALLDEIWKQSGPLAASLLSILNERRFFDGNEMKTIPLRSVVAASNELPYGPEFDAVVDRIAVRAIIPSPKPDQSTLLRDIFAAKPVSSPTKITIQDWDQAALDVQNMPVGEAFIDFVTNELRVTLDKVESGLAEAVSVRRLKSGMNVAKAHAWLRGASEVERQDGIIYKDVCWNEPPQIESVRKIMIEICGSSKQTIGGNNMDDEVNAIVEDHQARMVRALQLDDHPRLAAIENDTRKCKAKLDDIERDWHRRLKDDPEYDAKIEQFKTASQILARQSQDALDQ